MAYYYLISSLPMLTQGETPLISVADFLSTCEDWLPEAELKALHSLELQPKPEFDAPHNSAIAQWSEWETALRNQLTNVRGARLSKETEQFSREQKGFFSEIERGVQEAYSASNPLERENTLDRLRWKRLEDMESGHLFDFDKLCLYKLQLLICEKQAKREVEKGEENFDRITGEIFQKENSEPEN